MASSDKKIVLENLNKYYNAHTKNSVHVINNTNLNFDSTGLVCLLGESGSGKTTLLNVISGIDKADSGNIYLDGIKLNYKSKNTEYMRNNKFAYVFQNYYMINDETVYDNLALALAPYKLSENEIKTRIEYVLERVEMKRYIKRKVNQLSGGQIQRVAIARALVKNPEVIFADEPTGNLDESTTLKIMTILKKISKNCLVILATHEKRIASFFASRIIQINDGKVINDYTLNDNTDEIYSQFSNRNLYLKEYKRSDFEDKNYHVEFYENSLNQDKLNLKIILDHGKYYLQTLEENKIEVISKDSSIQIIDAKKPVIDKASVDSFDYHLDKLNHENFGKLSFKDFIKRVLSVSRSKSFNIIIIALILISCLFVVSVGDFMTISKDNVNEVISTDSRQEVISLKENTNIIMAERKALIGTFYDSLTSSIDDDTIVLPNYNIYSYLEYDGYKQIMDNVTDVTTSFVGFSFVPLDYLDENSLIAGRMPEKMTEVVCDEWALLKYMENETVMSKSYTKVETFIGTKILAKATGIEFTIVGVARTNNMSVYANERMIINAAYKYTDIALMSDLVKEMPEYSYLEDLKDDESMYRVDVNFDSTEVSLTSTIFLKVKTERINKSFSAKLIISDQAYEKFKKELVCNAEEILIYSKDKEKVNEIVENIDVSKLQLIINDDYQTKSDEYYKDRFTKILTRSIVTLMIFIVCAITLFITMKSHANENMQVNVVYRLLGIKKTQVILIYASEILVTSILVMLPSSLITLLILKFIAALPAINFTFVYSFLAYIISFALMLVINVFVGILPIAIMLKKTPAELVTNYDL